MLLSNLASLKKVDTECISKSFTDNIFVFLPNIQSYDTKSTRNEYTFLYGNVKAPTVLSYG